MLAGTCYSVGTFLALAGVSAVVGATLTDRALSGALRGGALTLYLLGLVAPFVAAWSWCVLRHFALVRRAVGAPWPATIAAVLAATVVLALGVGALLAASGLRGAA